MAIKLCVSANCTAAVKNGYGKCVEPEISYEGAVLATYERNGYDDSDFYAIVWDAQSKNFKHIEYASTRAWTYHNTATVDATPEVIAEAEIRLYEILVSEWTRKAQEEAEKPARGLMVESTTTRGKNVGVKGEVRWIGEDGYRSTRWLTVYRVGLKVEGQEKLTYLPAEKVRVINPEPVNVEEIERMARYRAKQHGWRTSL